MSLNLIQVVFSLDVGGVEKLIVEMARKINREQFNFSVCCLTKNGELSNQLEKEGVEIFYLGKKEGFDLGLIFRLAWLLRKQKADILHTHDNSTLLYGTLAAKLAGVKTLINTEHGGVYFESKRKKLINKALWKLNNKVTCVSQDIENDLIKMGLNRGKTLVIQNGIDLEPFKNEINKPDIRKKLGFNDSDFIVCTVGRLSKEKNHKLFIEMAVAVSAVLNNAKFLIIGDGSLKEELMAYARSRSIAEKIIFAGQRNDIPELLKATDCFVLTSDYESFGLVLLEAMAAGTPVVTTNAGGIEEIVISGKTGLVVQKNDVQGLSSSIIRLANNPIEREMLAKEASSLVGNRYSIDKMIYAYQELYRSLGHESTTIN